MKNEYPSIHKLQHSKTNRSQTPIRLVQNQLKEILTNRLYDQGVSVNKLPGIPRSKSQRIVGGSASKSRIIVNSSRRSDFSMAQPPSSSEKHKRIKSTVNQTYAFQTLESAQETNRSKMRTKSPGNASVLVRSITGFTVFFIFMMLIRQ